MRRTLHSVMGQSLPPALWVVVDDGSTDETLAILAEYAERHPAIRVVRRDDRGDRAVGGGVIEAFYSGYETIDPRDFDFVCKLDFDLEMPPRYFETLIRRFEEDPRLGSCSGKAYFERNGDLVPEPIGDDVSVGAAKFYRTECFLQIGGFIRQTMWDGIDCHRCRMLGWKVCSLPDQELRFLHLRPMGSSQTSMFHGRMRHGSGQYFMGTSVMFMLASAVFRLFKAPVLVGSVAILCGYFGAMLKQIPRYSDREFRSFLRRYQMLVLFRRKRHARSVVEAEGAARWEPDPEQSARRPSEMV